MSHRVKSLLDVCLETIQQRSFHSAYDKTFELLKADTPGLRHRVFRLRYDVYCQENGFADPCMDAKYIECDAFDERAVHYLLLHRQSGESAGTVRISLSDDAHPENSFEAQRVCDHPILELPERVRRLAEISRFCTAPRFRKRKADGRLLSSYSGQDGVEGHRAGMITFMRRRIPYMQAALLRAAMETAMQARILDCIWLVEPQHLDSLGALGMPFRVLGPQVAAHGGLQPIIFNIKNALDAMQRRNPACWAVISDQGRLQTMADTLHDHGWNDNLMDEACRELIFRRLAE